jgi:hypothetical protein
LRKLQETYRELNEVSKTPPHLVWGVIDCSWNSECL